MARASNGATAAIVPPLATLSSLMGKVSRQYEQALRAQSIFFYPSNVTIVRQRDGEQHNADVKMAWTVRCVTALLDKEKDKHRGIQKGKESQKEGTNSTAQQNPSDVFAPPYHPDLLVEELPQHTILLNKFCVVPKHFLLVTRTFQPQTMPPAPEMLAIAFRILTSHRAQSTSAAGSKELLAFYNCGEASGASQPHQHMQFAELGGEEEGAMAVPVETLLARVPKDGREDDVYALPLPYQHFVSLIKEPPIDDDAALQTYLGSKLLSLIDALFQARMVQATASVTANGGSPVRRAPPSWNLLMTTQAIHLIPRQREVFDGLAEMVQAEGVAHVEDGVHLVGPLSINSLGYAGHLLVKSAKELEYLQKYQGGVVEILKQTGTPPVDDITTATKAT